MQAMQKYKFFHLQFLNSEISPSSACCYSHLTPEGLISGTILSHDSHPKLVKLNSYAPYQVGAFKLLTHLHLENNSITCLPDDIGLLRSLRELNLSRNLLTTLPPTIALLLE